MLIGVFVLLGVLSVMGVEVGGLLAGLGIGGLAVAFAAQEAIENLFGAVSIGTDRPFRIGISSPWTTLEGTVEDMGFRSVRIRTMQRTVVTIRRHGGRRQDCQLFRPRPDILQPGAGARV